MSSLKLVKKEKPACGALPTVCVFTTKNELGNIRRMAIPVDWISMVCERDDDSCDLLVGQDTWVNILEPLEVCLALHQEALAESICEEIKNKS